MDHTTQLHKKIEGVCKKVKEYLDIRFSHASRINPNIAHIYEDMVWQQLEALRITLGEAKAFGPVKFITIDVLTGDDDAKRKAMFSPTDQNSIMNQILNMQDKDDKKKTAGILAIKDLRSFYQALNPALEKILELMQTWIWWDLGDACDVYHFELQVARISALRDNDLTDNIIEYYRKIHKKAAEEITKEFILAIEIEKLKHLLDRFESFRKAEEGHQMVIKRDEIPGRAVDQSIVNLSKRIMTLEKVKTSQVIEPAIKDFYAKTLGCTPAEVTKEKIIENEESVIRELKSQLAKSITQDKTYGSPYNFKLSQLNTLKENYAKLEASMPFLKAEIEHLKELEAEEKEAQKRASSSFY